MSEQDDVDRVKQSLDLERIISSQSSDWTTAASAAPREGRCTHPVHGHTSDGDNAGNLIVTDGAEQGWYCYSHDSGGDVLDWIAVEEGITSCRDPHPAGDDFIETLRAAADRAGVELSSGETDFEDLPEKRQAEIELAEVVDRLHGKLDKVVSGKTVRTKLKEERGFTGAAIDAAKIGWIDDPTYAELQQEFGNETLKRTGFQTEDGNVFISGRIIYPYLQQGKPRYWTGRVTEESSFEDAKYRKPKGDCPLEQPVHTMRPPDQAPSGPVWIVEGIQDSISTATNGGVKAVTAVATNPSGEQRRQLFDVARRSGSAVVCFDSDDSGVSKSIDLALELMDEGIHTQIASVPSGDDPNDFFVAGGDFDDIQPTQAVEKIISERGDNDTTIERILRTVEPETPRADRTIAKIAEMTDIRKRTLRRKVRERVRTETSSGWKEPVEIRKRGRVDKVFVFVYDDGSKIEIEDIGSRNAYSRFRSKYASQFNYVPTFKKAEFDEMLNRWLSEVEVEDVNPMSMEGIVLEVTMEQLQSSSAVEDKDDLASRSVDAICYRDDGEEVLVLRDTLLGWLEDYETNTTQLSHYLRPIRAGKSTRLTVDGKRRRFWRFSAEAIREEGYTLPDPVASPDTDDIDEEVGEI